MKIKRLYEPNGPLTKDGIRVADLIAKHAKRFVAMAERERFCLHDMEQIWIHSIGLPAALSRALSVPIQPARKPARGARGK